MNAPPGAQVLELRTPPAALDADAREEVLATLEGGGIVFFPELGFELTDRESDLISDPEKITPGASERSRRNGRPTFIFDPKLGRMLGRHRVPALDEIESALGRFSSWAVDLVHELLPSYRGRMETDRVTYRPVARETTQGLHVDSSYLRPHRGRGMLRVFCNVNPAGEPRIWRIGEEPFESFARRFLPGAQTAIPARVRFVDFLASKLGLAARRATACDHLMADIRGQAKRDQDFQKESPQRQLAFPAGSTWVAFTDLVIHGAVSGQHSVDQTFFVPAAAMRAPSRSSLQILERLTRLDLQGTTGRRTHG